MFSKIILVFFLNLLITTTTSSLSHIEKSQQILNYINFDVDPCQDFYEFSCGNYGKYITDILDRGYLIWSVLNNITNSMNLKMAKILDNKIEASDRQADKKVKKFYESCLNIKGNSKENNVELNKVLREFGKMPVLEPEWQAENFDWQQVIAAIRHETSLGIIFNVKIMPDFTNNSINTIAILQPRFSFDKFDNDFGFHQRIFIMDAKNNLMHYMGLDETKASQVAMELFQFEVELAQAMQDFELTPPEQFYALNDIDEIQRKYESVWDTKRLIKQTLDIDIDSPKKIMIQRKYLENAFKVLKRTAPHMMANYIFYKYFNKFTNDIIIEENGSLNQQCQQVANIYFPDVIQNMLYRKYFTGKDEKIIEILWPQLRQSLEEIMQSSELNWLKVDQTLNIALKKLQDMQLKIDNYEDIDFDQKFKNLQINEQNIVANIREILKMQAAHERLRWQKSPEFRMPPIFSPSYTPEENVIHLPISLLQTENPWSIEYPLAINFASLGLYIAHEMLHGFDDIGRFYDSTGSSLNWMHPRVTRQFNSKVQCLAEQYHSYKYGKRHLPKLHWQLENIADNGGLHVAYKAYERWRKDNSEELKLEMDYLRILNITNTQLFFIAYSQSWCTGTAPTFNCDFDEQDVHMPQKLRIIGSLSNFEEFSKAFNCPRGSVMNPVKKCKIY